MPRSIIIGYGNIDRADDGVACEVINALRRLQGRKPLTDEGMGFEDLGAEVDTLFVYQLSPEILELLADYDRIVFVDAHVYPEIDDLYCRPVLPEGAPSTLMHHFSPETLLALLKALYGKEPDARLVSVRGYDFDFHRGLSGKTREISGRAVAYIRQWLGERGHGGVFPSERP